MGQTNIAYGSTARGEFDKSFTLIAVTAANHIPDVTITLDYSDGRPPIELSRAAVHLLTERPQKITVVDKRPFPWDDARVIPRPEPPPNVVIISTGGKTWACPMIASETVTWFGGEGF